LRPRDRLSLAEDPTFNHYCAEVVKFLHERHRKPRIAPVPGEQEPPTLRLAANA
jgi:nitrate/nitrite transport system ATP-binding protein